MKKKEKMRELICEAINILLDLEYINLQNLDDIKGELYVNIFNKPSKILWYWIGFEELRISVWWWIKDKLKDSITSKPLNRNLIDALDVCCSWWLDRKDWTYLQWFKWESIFDTYCSRNSEKDLLSIPRIEYKWYKKEGKVIY